MSMGMLRSFAVVPYRPSTHLAPLLFPPASLASLSALLSLSSHVPTTARPLIKIQMREIDVQFQPTVSDISGDEDEAEDEAKSNGDEEDDSDDERADNAEINEFNERRARNVARNKKRLSQLGLGGTWREQQKQQQLKPPAKKKNRPKAPPPEPRTMTSRKAKSKRIKYAEDSGTDDDAITSGEEFSHASDTESDDEDCGRPASITKRRATNTAKKGRKFATAAAASAPKSAKSS